MDAFNAVDVFNQAQAAPETNVPPRADRVPVEEDPPFGGGSFMRRA
jgi:hypothetical protein